MDNEMILNVLYRVVADGRIQTRDESFIFCHDIYEMQHSKQFHEDFEDYVKTYYHQEQWAVQAVLKAVLVIIAVFCTIAGLA